MCDWLSRFAPKRLAYRPRRYGFRVGLEALEDRCCPSISGDGMEWSDPVGTNCAYAVAVNAAGDIYMASSNADSLNGPMNVEELDPSGNLLHSSPNLPGAGGGMALDSAGNIYLTTNGNTVTELDPTLQTVLFSVTLPGATQSGFGGGEPGTSSNAAITVAGGNIYVAGAAGPGLPTTAGAYQRTWAGVYDSNGDPTTNAYLAVIDPSSSAPYHLTYCTYLGGSWFDAASGVAVDSSGNAYLTGTTESTNFATSASAFQRKFGGGLSDAFVAKFNPAAAGAASLAYSTYLGGKGQDGYNMIGNTFLACPENSPSIAVDASGNAYVDGSTTSTNFPTTRGAYQPKFGGVPSDSKPLFSGDAFVTKLNPTGSGLVYSTYLGGSGWDGASGIAIDAAGDAFVTGWTWSTNFPTVNPTQSRNAGNADAFVAELNSAGNGLLFSTYFGGANDDWGMSVLADGSGDIYVVGAYNQYGLTNCGWFFLKITP
jgi:hypothetical protein